MKKNLFFVVLVAVFVMFTVSNAQAWGKKKTAVPEVKKDAVQGQPEKTVQPVVPETQAAAVPQPKEMNNTAVNNKDTADKTDQKALRDKARKSLDNTSWNAEIFPIAGGGKIQKDDLIFSDNKFYADQFNMKGFTATNYTLTLKDDGMIIWETMQSAADGQVIFWRGEINKEMTEMRGVLSKQKASGESDSFTFVSKEKMPVKK